MFIIITFHCPNYLLSNHLFIGHLIKLFPCFGIVVANFDIKYFNLRGKRTHNLLPIIYNLSSTNRIAFFIKFKSTEFLQSFRIFSLFKLSILPLTVLETIESIIVLTFVAKVNQINVDICRMKVQTHIEVYKFQYFWGQNNISGGSVLQLF